MSNKCDCYTGEQSECSDCRRKFVLIDSKVFRKIRRLHKEGGCQPSVKNCVFCEIEKAQ